MTSSTQPTGGGWVPTGAARWARASPRCARAGYPVTVVEVEDQVARAGQARLEGSLRRAERRGRVASAAGILGRIEVVTSLDALADRDVVVEALTEDEEVKTRLFGEVDRVVTTPDAVLASNTSSIPIMKLAVATERPEQVLGIHCFNPVPVLSLVEIVPSLLTSHETLERARTFMHDGLGKKAIDCTDRAGFVVNALLIPFLLSAIRMMESGFAIRDRHRRGPGSRLRAPPGPARCVAPRPRRSCWPTATAAAPGSSSPASDGHRCTWPRCSPQPSAAPNLQHLRAVPVARRGPPGGRDGRAPGLLDAAQVLWPGRERVSQLSPVAASTIMTTSSQDAYRLVGPLAAA